MLRYLKGHCTWEYREFEKHVIREHQFTFNNAREKFLKVRLINSLARGFIARRGGGSSGGVSIADKKLAIVKIQRWYRQILAKRKYNQLLHDTINRQIIIYFHCNAITIQKHYRGYWSRKSIYDYYKLKEWLASISKKNIELCEETCHYIHKEREIILEQENKFAMELCIYIATKLHHLLRTHAQPGIYSFTNSKRWTNIEQLLRAFSFKEYVKEIREHKKKQKAKYVDMVNKIYARTTADKKNPFRTFEENWRYRSIDRIEEEMRQKCPPSNRSPFKAGPVEHPHTRPMFATEPYCDKIIQMTRQFDIFKPGKDFCLNTSIVHKPERIEEFLLVLKNFCIIHNIVEK